MNAQTATQLSLHYWSVENDQNIVSDALDIVYDKIRNDIQLGVTSSNLKSVLPSWFRTDAFCNPRKLSACMRRRKLLIDTLIKNGYKVHYVPEPDKRSSEYIAVKWAQDLYY